jgi:polysaccharide pyruvyl transferase WcaK-like protein
MKLNVYDSKDKEGTPIIAIEYDREFAYELAKKLQIPKLTRKQIHSFLIESFDSFLCDILESGNKRN